MAVIRPNEHGRAVTASMAQTLWPKRLAPRGELVSLVLIVLAVATLAMLGWYRRWMSDDGLIVLRTVRQLLAGNGPVLNMGERVETNTSTLWTYLLTLYGLVGGADLAWGAIFLGLGASALGLALASLATRRVWGLYGTAPTVPAGALVVCALPPSWDFATSGLETGLITGWLGLSWWLLVAQWRRPERQNRSDEPRSATAGAVAWPAAVVVGLGPLVRPDLGVFSLAAFVALVVIVRPGARRTAGLLAAAGAVPLAYEIFRAGYYGILVPSPALAKEASSSEWGYGFIYLADFVHTHWLWFPVALLLVTGGFFAREALRVGERWATTALLVAPMLAAVVMGLYVVRVGGDFMHGRMLLPALFSLLLPVLVLPCNRRALPGLVLTLAWAVLSAAVLRVPYAGIGPHGIADERGFYTAELGERHPVSIGDHRANAPPGVAELLRSNGPVLISVYGPPHEMRYTRYPMRDDADHSTIAWYNLGITGALMPLDVRVVDPIGLATPLAAHSRSLSERRIGHNKQIPADWFVAQEARPSNGAANSEEVRQARWALECPALLELDESVRAPLTPERFWFNLTGSVQRTSLRYSGDPTVTAYECPQGESSTPDSQRQESSTVGDATPHR